MQPGLGSYVVVIVQNDHRAARQDVGQDFDEAPGKHPEGALILGGEQRKGHSLAGNKPPGRHAQVINKGGEIRVAGIQTIP
ncbi:MAG: hypothetical protein MPW15_15575 [Candidatus Manganitrophus sp.]|nr:hypothetical protein [Candidatus Manganitrophus sp.]